MSKTFDTLGHSKLLAKRQSYGLEDIELEWFTHYLFGRAQTVKVNETPSLPCSVFSGVLQSSILGPTLFIIFF